MDERIHPVEDREPLKETMEETGLPEPGTAQAAGTEQMDDEARYDQVPKGTGERVGPFYRCLMVTTGQEEYVRRLLEAMHLGTGIIPKRVRVRKIKGEWYRDEVPLLPGYLFVHEEDEVPIWKYQQLLNVLRVLRYDKEPYGYMRDRDMLFARTLFGVNGMISPLKAVDEGDFIRITDGLLKDLNGTVLTVDRHKRQAKIRLNLMGMTKVVYMNYMLLEKVKTEDEEHGAEQTDGNGEQPGDAETGACTGGDAGSAG